jgi:hypothetical protein
LSRISKGLTRSETYNLIITAGLPNNKEPNNKFNTFA